MHTGTYLQYTYIPTYIPIAFIVPDTRKLSALKMASLAFIKQKTFHMLEIYHLDSAGCQIQD